MMLTRPNIIEIIGCNLGDWLGCYGRADVTTPALDTFAAQGALLQGHFSPASASSPARASLKTGLFPQSHGILGQVERGWRYRFGVPDLPELLGAAGYRTALIGAQSERSDEYDLAYEAMQPRAEDGTGAGGAWSAMEVAARVVAYLRGPQDAAPFFLSVGFSDVQRPWGGAVDPDAVDRVDTPPFLPYAPVVREDLAGFYDSIAQVDAAAGAILAALDEMGLADNTFVYVTADHGPDIPRARMTLYDAGLKVAFLCRWPGVIPAGRRLVRMSSHVDVLPTLLEAAGAPVPSRVEGRSFLQRLKGEQGVTRDAVFAQMTWCDGEYDPMRAIRTEQYKYICNFQPGWPMQIGGGVVEHYGTAFIVEHFAQPRGEEELYDLLEDPFELKNLADQAQYADIKAGLSDRLDDWLRAVNDPLLRGPVSAPDAARMGSGCVWVKARPHAPEREAFRWDILRTHGGDEPQAA